MEKVRAVGYIRQSRERESTLSPDAQRQRTRDFIHAQGWQLVDTFADVGISGYDPKAKRPGFNALVDLVHRGDVDRVVVYRLDRLTRRGVMEAVRIEADLRDHGAALVSTSEAIDTSTPIGKGVFALLASLAEQESANISQRTKAAKAVARSQGLHNYNGGPVPFGWVMSRERTDDGRPWVVLRLDPTEAPVLKEAARRVLNGESLRSITRDLNSRGVRTKRGASLASGSLTRLLRSPLTAGYAVDGRDSSRAPRLLLEDGRPVLTGWDALIGPDEWQRLQLIFDGRATGRQWRPGGMLLTGIIKCASCGAAMTGDRMTRSGIYRCAARKDGRPCETGGTIAAPLAEDFVVRAVWKRVAALAVAGPDADPDDLALIHAAAKRFGVASEDDSTRAERRQAEATLAAESAVLLRLDAAMLAGAYDGRMEVYSAAVKTAKSAVDEAEATIGRLTRQTSTTIPFLDVVQTADDPEGDPVGPGTVWSGWATRMAHRREFLQTFLDRVEVSPHARGRYPGRVAEAETLARLRLVWASES